MDTTEPMGVRLPTTAIPEATDAVTIDGDARETCTTDESSPPEPA